MSVHTNRTARGRALTLRLPDGQRISGILLAPIHARAIYVLAHGAGAGMRHPFMASIAEGLAERGVATLRFQFPYMERGSKRPDSPALAHVAVRTAVAEAVRRLPRLPVFAGGKSFGGRMSSQAQALSAMSGVRGLIFMGFPLHPQGKASVERAEHLFEVTLPMLFLQGTRDELADLPRLKTVCARLRKRATLRLFREADHSFHVPARSGQTDTEIRTEVMDALEAWVNRVIKSKSRAKPVRMRVKTV